MAQHQGRKGRPWRRVREQLRAMGMPCWLCGHPIHYGAHHLHPLSFTADHVVPRSKGGAPTLDNVRAAHRKCNLQRGARTDWSPSVITSRTW
jgi:5-methylcytosine-specific restriction endonuclease McrA